MIEEIIERFYEAAFIPDEWSHVLEQTSNATASATGTLFVFGDNAPPTGRTSPGAQPLFDDFIRGDVWRTCESVQRMCAIQPASFVNVDDYLSQDEIERDPIRIRLREAGIGSNICTSIALPTGELLMFVFQRWLKDGHHAEAAVSALSELRPHMARAGLVAARLRLERARTTVSALEAIGLPAMTLSSSGKVLASNRLMEAMSPLVAISASDRLRISIPALDRLFQECLEAASKPQRYLVRSIPLPAQNGNGTAVLHFIPLVRNAKDILGGDIIVVATAVTSSSFVPDPSVLSGLFDLAPAEAKLATSLFSGLTLQDAAKASNVTFKTARTYLERIFVKTGVHRQSELIALLKNTAPIARERED
jgi:DNA-binding CsgD family transcriptional regulator